MFPFQYVILTLIITSWKCLIKSHMPSGFTIGKHNSLLIQSDMKIWGLHRSKYHTSSQACKKAHRNCLCHTMHSKGPSILCYPHQQGCWWEEAVMWITPGSLRGVLTWIKPRNFSSGCWKNCGQYTDVSFSTWNGKNSISLLGLEHPVTG